MVHERKMLKQAIKIAGVLSVLVNVSLATIEIGAFNMGVYGKTKASRPDVVSICMQVAISSRLDKP